MPSLTLLPQVLIALGVLVGSQLAVAQSKNPLNDLIGSEVLEAWSNESASLPEPEAGARGIDQDMAGYSRLFRRSDSGKLLEKWLAVRGEAPKIRYSHSFSTRKYASSKRYFQLEADSGIVLHTIVPHPSFEEIAHFNLDDMYAQMEAPRLSFDSTQKVTLAKRPWLLRVHTMAPNQKKQLCSLYGKFRHSLRIVMYSACDQVDTVTSLAERLTVSRLEEMLDS